MLNAQKRSKLLNKDICGRENAYILLNKTIIPKRNYSLHLGNSLYKNLKSTYIEILSYLGGSIFD